MWFCRHKFMVAEWRYFRDIEGGGNCPSTKYTIVCKKCGKVKAEKIYGHKVDKILFAKAKGWEIVE